MGDEKIKVYGISLNFTRPLVTNVRPGMYMGLDRPHETNHGEECRQTYSRLFLLGSRGDELEPPRAKLFQ